MHKKIAVIGAGAAGMMAAGRAAELGAEVTLYEKNRTLGRKLLITGKGRCNLTNACDQTTFIANVLRNPRFLYTAVSRFSPEDTMAFFEAHGVPLKVERGNRVFPLSDRSADVVAALRRYLAENGVRLVNVRVNGISSGRVSENSGNAGIHDLAPVPLDLPSSFAPGRAETDGPSKTDGTAGPLSGASFSDVPHDKEERTPLLWVAAGGKKFPYDAVILATGGCSYPLTGSTGDGFAFARSLGHSVTPLRGSLVPLVCREDICRRLQGLSLRNVSVRALDETGRTVFSDFGELLFTHYGLTGPVILSLSAFLPDIGERLYRVVIDLKPALTEAELDRRLLSDFARYGGRDFVNGLDDLLPRKLIEPFVLLTGISPHKKIRDIGRDERKKIVFLLKNLTLTILRARPIEEAIVTAGGVSVREVDPKTMASKSVPGLYFAGEILDVDAYTGGFNLQIAFSTGRLAAESALTAPAAKEEKRAK